jgi:hypothetical protein
MPWNPLQTHDPKLGQDRLKNKLVGQGIVVNKGHTRDLEQLATEYVAYPSIWKRMLHSSFILPARRSVQSKGAFGAAAARGLQQGIVIAFKQIPVPVLNSLLSNAFDKACNQLRDYVHKSHHKVGKFGVTDADKVKFELKELGQEVEKLDGYRWKISHAIDEYNKAVKEAEDMVSQPCDRWVHVLVKFKYLSKRIVKLRTSIEMIKATCAETEKWLAEVESEYHKTATKLEPLMKDDLEKLKNFAGAHETCTEEFCMYKDKKYSESRDVPTSETADMMAKGVGKVSDYVTTKLTDYF